MTCAVCHRREAKPGCRACIRCLARQSEYLDAMIARGRCARCGGKREPHLPLRCRACLNILAARKRTAEVSP